MTKTILMIMGKSGSGKSTLERELVERYPNLFHKIVSVTTRSPRSGEQDGVDYCFITEDEYADLDMYDELIQTTQFAGNSYGSLYYDYMTPHPYATLVVTPLSAATFIPVLEDRLPSAEVVVIYFDLPEDVIRSNMIERGDDPEQIEQRLKNDNLDRQFVDSGLTADFTITELTTTLTDNIVGWLSQRDEDMNNG